MEAIEAINLRSFDYRDSSLIVVAFSREYGRVSLLARGAKKSAKSSTGLLQSFCHNRYILGHKRDLSIITSIDSLNTFAELSVDLDRIQAGYECLHLIQAVVQDDHAAPKLFDLCQNTLKALCTLPKDNLSGLLRQFKTQLLHEEGLLQHAETIPDNIDELVEQYIHTRPINLSPSL